MSVVCSSTVCCRCTIICQISLVVTRPVLVPVLVSSTGSGAAWVCSLSTRACLLVRTVVVGARFSVTTIPVPLRVVVVARGSGAPVVRHSSGVSSRSAHNTIILYRNSINHNVRAIWICTVRPETRLSTAVSRLYSDIRNQIYLDTLSSYLTARHFPLLG